MAHRILFVGMGNSSASQMAVGFARHYGLEADSAGTLPAHELYHGAVVAMQEKGIDIGKQAPKRLDFKELGNYERVIAMGPWVHVASPDLILSEVWDIDDPTNMPFPVVRAVRDQVEEKVKALAEEIQAWTASQ